MLNSIICLWAGAIADIPAGWVLCNGDNETPDLQDRFVIGSGAALNPNDTAPTNVATDAGIAYYSLAFIMKS